MASDKNQKVLIPLKLDAFVFNRPVFNAASEDNDPACHPSKTESPGGPGADKPVFAKMAPIVQPNYTFLRLDTDYIQSDILDPIDLHNSWPAEFNSRFRDLGTDEDRVRRQGVYLHWTIPRLYRSGVAAAKQHEAVQRSVESRIARGLPVDGEADDGQEDYEHLRADGDENKKKPIDPTVPAFPNVPNRWLVIRHIADPKTIEPEAARPRVPEFDAWVVDSNYLRDLDQLDAKVDLQVDVSPFISAEDGTQVDLAKQAEVFIGRKTPLASWEETKDDKRVRQIKHFSLLASSNQLFADYQPHCSNVFSIVDNFEYEEGRFLTRADASYYVVGWHADEEDDMFCGDPKKPQTMSRQARLDELKLKIKLDEELEEGKRRRADVVFEDWLQALQPTHTLCHGAMYNVRWNKAAKPCRVPADTFSKQLNSALPLAVGTTPMDALLAYARAHQDIDPKELGRLEELILGLETHLLARDDGVETQQQARDLLYNWNYVRADGGQAWNIAGKAAGEESGAVRPGTDTLKNLRALNRQQQLLDAIQRTTARLRWELFAEWWRYVTDRNRTTGKKDEDDKRDRVVKKRVEALGARIDALELRRKGCEDEIAELSRGDSMQPGAKPAFYQQRDPTLVVGCVTSGWTHDYLDTLQIRVDSQIVAAEDPPIPGWGPFADTLLPKLPEPLRAAIKRLVSEFTNLSRATRPQEPTLTGVQQLPLFHDDLAGAKLKGPWRDRWNNTQAWFPLFLEWGVEYVHIPYDEWTLDSRGSRTSTVSQLRYGIRAATDLEEKYRDKSKRDRHLIQGRALILPQPSFSLEAKIKQLFASTPSDKLDGGKTLPDGAARDELQRDLHKLAFMSAPLAGLTAHLTTVLQGSHIKPNLRDGATGNVEPISQAERDRAGFDRAQLKRMGAETDSTPFGTEKKSSTTGHPLFKPATHGQFRFTRLNIIDKFGQAIHAIDPTPTLEPQKVWPCIGEWYAPQIWGGDPAGRAPNVIERELQPGSSFNTADDPGPDKKKPKQKPQPCEFVQVPPQINQLSRLNSVFIKPASSTAAAGAPFWKPADEWESPIWGWVLINYANVGIQLFQADGSFYREVRMAGPTGAQTGPEWLPFPPPTTTTTTNADPSVAGSRELAQLQLLARRLGDDAFLRAFWQVLVAAADHMLPAPDAYAGFANALVGRPVALAHAGWSLELAADALVSQVAGDLDPEWVLLAQSRSGADAAADKNDGGDQGPQPKRYVFPVRLGDDERGFDGLVGYFPCRKDLDTEKNVTDLGLDLSTLSTHYSPPANAPDAPVARPTHIPLPAFWESPEGPHCTADTYAEARNRHLAVYGVLVDPFAPLHSYSGVQPVRELALPAWTWQDAMARMKAFFHAGPLVVTADVPDALVAGRELRPQAPVVLPEADDVVKPVGLPAVAGGDWAWLQPYMPREEGRPPGGEADQQGPDDGNAVVEKFMPLPVKVDDERARFQSGPYTALEGYIMMVGRDPKDQGKT